MKRKWIVSIIIIVVCIIIVCFIQSASNKKLEAQPIEWNDGNISEIRVAVQQYYISSPIGYILDNKLDEKFGLKLIPIEYPSGAEQIRDVDKDKYDVATIGAAFLFPTAEDKAVVIGEHIKSTSGNSIYVRKDSPILKVKGFNPTFPSLYGDLETVKGSIVLMQENTTSQYIGLKWLESIGVQRQSVNIEYMNLNKIYNKFEEGYGDIAVLGAPDSYQAEKNGFVKIASTDSLHADIYEVLMATKKAHMEKTDELIRFVRLMLYTNRILEENNNLKLSACENWYQEHDMTFTSDTLKKECRDKQFVTRDNYSMEDFGEFELKYAEYMVAIGNIAPINLQNVEKNIDRELFKEAFEQE